jgi:hypothetical protein
MPMRLIIFRHWLVMLLVAGILWELGFLYWDILLWMKTAWFGYTPDRAGILVPPLFLWMAYIRLKHRPEMTTGAPFPGFFIMLCCLAAFILARVIDINFIQSLSLIGVIFGMVVFLGGIRLGGTFLFPFAFLMLMVPSVSYLIESIAGAFLRQAVLHGSYILLRVTGGVWQMHPAGLMSGNVFLHVGFPRGGPSSLLFLLIVHFALTEWFLKREGRKFFFMVHFPLYFAVAYILYYSLAGWVVVLAGDRMSAVLASVEAWMPTMLFFFFTGMVLFLAGRGEGKRSHRLRGGR